MDDEIALVRDGDSLAVVGNGPTVAERFLTAEGLTSRDLGLHRLGPSVGTAGAALQAASGISDNWGRWVKLTEDSAAAANRLPLVKDPKTGNFYAIAKTQNGRFAKNLQIVAEPGSLLVNLTNPAALASVGVLMSQQAMLQAMDEIKDYLAKIDEKVDDVLRAQKDAVLADMIGVDLVIEEAMTIREHVDRVDEVTWSKVQGTALAIAQAQGYALLQLDGLAKKVEDKAKLGDLAKTTKEAESTFLEWLAVLAHSFRLLDGLAVLELDRVLGSSPDDLNQHRLGLTAARQNRLDLISQRTGQLMDRMRAAGAIGLANANILRHPVMSRAVVESSDHVVAAVADFHDRLGIERDRQHVGPKRWLEALAEVRDKALETGAGAVDSARALGTETLDRARSATDKLTIDLAEQALRRQAEARGPQGTRGYRGPQGSGRLTRPANGQCGAVGYAIDMVLRACQLRQRQDRRPVDGASDIAYWGRWRRRQGRSGVAGLEGGPGAEFFWVADDPDAPDAVGCDVEGEDGDDDAVLLDDEAGLAVDGALEERRVAGDAATDLDPGAGDLLGPLDRLEEGNGEAAAVGGGGGVGVEQADQRVDVLGFPRPLERPDDAGLAGGRGRRRSGRT